MPCKDKKKYNAYMRTYMKPYRANERALIKRARKEWGNLDVKPNKMNKAASRDMKQSRRV